VNVRFAPSETGTLHVGNALGTVDNRNAGGAILLRIDDTDQARKCPGDEDAILDDRSRDLDETAELRRTIPERSSVSPADERATLERFRELRARDANDLDREGAKTIVRELKAVGGRLRAVRQALTGRDSGPELWAVLAALPREETLARVDAAL
jgi:glutamyl/glutaminyl-tRNA synthetase